MKIKIKKFLNNYYNWNPPEILIYISLIIFTLFVLLIVFSLDNDFWFLINMGKYIVNNGLPLVEPFTIHSNLSITVQQWLTDIIFYFIYNKFDVYGMYVFTLIIYVLIILVMYKLSKLVNNGKTKMSFFTTLIIGGFLGRFFITTRPQIFDCLFILLELYLLELYIHKNNKLYLLGLPVISLLMINLHASVWPMLFVILIPYFIDKIVKLKYFDKDKYSLKLLIIITIVMILVGFINPYGIDAITYLFKSYGVSDINNLVGEMLPVTSTDFIGILIYILIFIILFSYYYNKGNKDKLRYLLLFLGTTYLGLSHFKGILFLLLVSILLINYNFRNIKNENIKSYVFYKNKKMNIFMIVFLIIYIVIYGYIVYSFDIKEKNINYLNNIVKYLDNNASKDDKIYTGYNDGGYLEYMGYKCYIDPRAEVFLKTNNEKEDILHEYVLLLSGKLHYKEFLNKYDFDYLVVGDYELLYEYIQLSDGYEIVYEEALEVRNKTMEKYRIFKKVK